MLELVDVKKDYQVAGESVHALRGVSVKFRKNEFVSILGASGCGKTTLLNIIGGLDKYTSGDLIIEGVSTKKFNDRDWDTYRNHSIGFIFQSYHLIPHQTILQNVELALTISGVSREERKQRSIEALEKVGLADKIKNRPNQLSGGQAQRVAIARALINDPEIVLADEPTGALDSKTSVQIMELLKEIAKDRLVIMVTHNPELAEKYSTRIIRLLDGEVVDDSMPYDGEEEIKAVAEAAESAETAENGENSPEIPPVTAETDQNADGERETSEEGGEQSPAESAAPAKKSKGKKKRSSMSIGMAFALSAKNLLSKRKRTAMVSIAGSIGIIGVSMVLAVSAGVTNFIAGMEDDMLSGNPLTITESALDFNALMNLAKDMGNDTKRPNKNKVFVDSLLETLMGLNKATSTVNKIDENYIEYVSAMPETYYNAMQYGYDFNIANNIYTDFTVTDNTPIDPSADASGKISVSAIRQSYTSVLLTEKDYISYAGMISTASSFEEMPDNYEYILKQYDIVAASPDGTRVIVFPKDLSESQLKSIFEDKDSLVLVLDDFAVTDITLGQYGYLTQEEFLDFAYRAIVENGVENDNYDEALISKYIEGKEYGYFLGEGARTFTWYPNDTVYVKNDGADKEEFNIVSASGVQSITDNVVYKYRYRADEEGNEFDEDGKIDMKVKALLQRKDGINYGCLKTGMYYTNALTRHMLENSAESEIAQYIINISQNKKNQLLPFLPYHYEFSLKVGGKEGSYIKVTPKTSTPGLPEGVSDEMLTTGFITKQSGSGSLMSRFLGGSGSTDPFAAYRITPAMLGGSDLPVKVSIYPIDFDSKDLVTDYLDAWNDACDKGTITFVNSSGDSVTLEVGDGDKVKYTDAVGLIITMINNMIQIITIALIVFTALSLVVSTVMVGIITYVSVVERIKEIGILRAVGARKKDIKRLFNAETFIIGLAAGVVGIIVTYLLSLIINIVLGAVAGITGIAALPWWQAIIMICVSVGLTLISGLIPAAAAAKKDPVVALRTE